MPTNGTYSARTGWTPPSAAKRTVAVKFMTDIKPQRVRWLWKSWISTGSLTLLSGREGSGKSTFAYSIAAQVTRGTLPGQYHGKPRGVVIVATEDSLEKTIVPRLLAHGADLGLVAFFEVKTPQGFDSEVTLPDDLEAVEAAVKSQADTGTPFVLATLDPLISRLGVDLDSHKDAEVRVGLEPLVALADRNDLAVVGLIHHNKGKGDDPLLAVMASMAFVAVARQVLAMGTDPQDATGVTKLLAQLKSNLGPRRTGTEVYKVEEVTVGTDAEGAITSGKLVWQQHRVEEWSDLMKAKRPSTTDPLDGLNAAGRAAIWLQEFLEAEGGSAKSTTVLEAGVAAGHSQGAVRQAQKELTVKIVKGGFQGRQLLAVG